MKCVLAIVLLVAVCQASERKLVPNGIKPLSREMTEFINSIDTTWKVSCLAVASGINSDA